MKTSWSPEGDLQFSVFRKEGQKLMYIGNESTHTPVTLRVIPSGVMNRLDKITSQKPSLHSEGVEKVCHDHANTLREACIAPPNFLTMGDLWKIQNYRLDIENEKEPDIYKKKNRNVYFCAAYSSYYSTSIHRVINRRIKYFNIYVTIRIMYYHRFNNLSELLNGYLAVKIGRGILPKDLMYR